jgi:predicted peroxiredoxin
MAKGVKDPSAAVREVCVRALYCFGRDHDAERAAPFLLAVVRNSRETDAARYFAIDGLIGLRGKVSPELRVATAKALLALMDPSISPTVRLQAAWGMGYLYRFLSDDLRARIVDALVAGFRLYGDGCKLSDAAFGWRVFGNALLQCAPRGRGRLEEMRAQKGDKWLRWIAYLTAHVPHRIFKIVPVTEQEAMRAHERFAPAFPGHRVWGHPPNETP